jgi:hypothetical protein
MVTAVQLQRHYLREVEAHLDSPFMPAWAQPVCQTWGKVLDQLEAAPEALSDQLDWALKLKLFQDRAERRGIAWKSLGAWNWLLTRVKACCEARGEAMELSRELIERHRSTALAKVADLFMQRLESHGQSWDQLDDFLALRVELFEIDMRYGQLGPVGLFNALDQAGVLKHEVIGVETIRHAIDNPPPRGRAKRRGEAVRRLASTPEGYACNWEKIIDHRQARIMRMHDPFVSSGECWETLNDPEETDSLFFDYSRSP